MKHFLMNLLGEMPILLVLGACYVIMDRVVFASRLSGLIRKGWAAKLRRMFNRRGRMFPLLPADPRTILTTVAWDEGLAGHTGELSPEPAADPDTNDSFVPASETGRRSGVVPPEDYDRVFADCRVEVIPTPGDNEEWIVPVPPAEMDTGPAYDGPTDHEAGTDDENEHYIEMDSAFGIVVSREQTARLKKMIRAAVDENFADVQPDDRPIDGFSMGDYV